jgi:hypothetical protein
MSEEIKKLHRALVYYQDAKDGMPGGFRWRMVEQRATKDSVYTQLRTMVFNLLGDKCLHCGFEDRRALQIDHIHGGGRKERKKSGYSNTWLREVITSIKNNEGKYQLLCANCNWIKRLENNEIHHAAKASDIGREIV